MLARHVPTPILLGIDSIGIDGIAVLVGIDIDWYSLNTTLYQHQLFDASIGVGACLVLAIGTSPLSVSTKHPKMQILPT